MEENVINTSEHGSEKGETTRRWGRRGLGCLTIIIVLLLAYYGSYFIFRGQVASNPQLIAHRGCPVYNPENTMAAFQYAIEVGANWLEFDVQRTMDDVLVVIHDKTVNRTTNGSGQVGEFTLKEIQELDAGNGERVPTFEQVIALAKQADVGIIPESKSPELYPGIAAQMI